MIRRVVCSAVIGCCLAFVLPFTAASAVETTPAESSSVSTTESTPAPSSTAGTPTVTATTTETVTASTIAEPGQEVGLTGDRFAVWTVALAFLLLFTGVVAVRAFV